MSLEDDPRYAALSPREKASMQFLLGGSESGGRRYNPYDRSLFDGPGGFGRKIDDNHFAAMREYYTRGKRNAPPPTQHAGEATIVKKPMLALPPGPKMLAITAKASC